ncbi:MAG: GHKL domain-containing protein [Clostridia bacterium]|nr:GHKL domain-containing protein [Clostridia bacterium]
MITTIFEILATLADTLMLVWFVTKILGVSLSKKKWAVLIPSSQFLVQLFFDWFMPGFSLIPMMIMLGFVFTFAMVLSPKTIWWNALTAIAYISLMMLVSTFLYSIFPFFIENMAEILQGSNTKVRILYLVIAKLMLFFVYDLILVLFKRDKSIETTNAIMTLILTFSTIFSLSAIMKIVSVVETDIIDIPVLLLAFSMITINIVLYLFIYKIQKLQKSKYELELINEQVAHEAEVIKETKKQYDELQKVRHDFNNTVNVIRTLNTEGKGSEIEEYIQEYLKSQTVSKTMIKTGNSFVDAVINSKLSEAQQDGIKVSISAISDLKSEHNIDLCSLIGNLLDNAVRASKESSQKVIKLDIRREGESVVIAVKNTIDSSVLDKNPALVSDKSDKKNHGYGTKIIREIAKKHSGFADFYEEDGYFCCNVMLYLGD